MNSYRITILSGSHLCHNPRVIKSASALQSAGYDVEVLGAWIDPELKARDLELLQALSFQFTPVLDATRSRWRWQKNRLCRKAAGVWHQQTGMETHWQLGYIVATLLDAAYERKTDLIIAHSEQALWAIAKLLRRGGRAEDQNVRLGVDMEDWFSEDLPLEVRQHRPSKLLRRLEREVLKKAAFSSCTSQAMAEVLAREYNCRAPVVIYNAFPWADREKIDGRSKDRHEHSAPSLHWYSQTLGMDRGLGDLLAALPLLKRKIYIHLRGKPAAGFEQWLAAKVPESWRERVIVHPLVVNNELLSRIAEHDIGFAGEQKSISQNKDFTVSNKILHYLLGGLAVVASDTAGQCEIAQNAGGAVRIYRSGNAEALAKELNTWLAFPDQLQAAQTSALRAAETTFCWERQVPMLLDSVEAALK